MKILNARCRDLRAFVGGVGLLRADDANMSGALGLCSIRLVGRRLKIASDNPLSQIGRCHDGVESAVGAAQAQGAPARLRGRGARLVSAASEPHDLRVREVQL